MKLEIELMPESCWGRSLRKRMRPADWRRLRKQVLDDQQHLCAICGATGRLSCHEVWEYDDASHTQTLVGFRAVCGLCHGVEHYGMSNVLAAQGSADLGSLAKHFCEVNSVDESEFRDSLSAARALNAEWCKHEWSIDLGEWTHLATREVALPSRPDGWDGVPADHLLLQGSVIESIDLTQDEELRLNLLGRTHHWHFRPYSYPEQSTSDETICVQLSGCALAQMPLTPAPILDCIIRVNGHDWSGVTPLPVSLEGNIDLRLKLESGAMMNVTATAISIVMSSATSSV